jgi:hypothetical protein
MNYAAHIAPDPVAQDYPLADEMAPSLDSFVSESTIVQTPPRAKDYRHPLWEFPEEGVVVSSSSPTPTLRRWRSAVPYTSLALAIIISTIFGFWWGQLIPSSRPIATAVETAQPVANAPVSEAFRATPNISPAQLTSSILVQPSVRPPVATIAAAVALKPQSSASEQRRTADREALSARAAEADQPVRTMPAIATRPQVEPTPTGPLTITNLPARPPTPVLEMPSAATVPPAVVPPQPSTSASAERPEPAALPSVAARTERSEIQRTLAQYRAAYDLLDAQAAQAVWPSVDVRALARAFDTLASQQLAFETCELQIAGESATAECRGSATYAPKIGNRGPKLEPRRWTFRLKKQGEEWKIQSAQTMR